MIISNTSPLYYLQQIRCLGLLGDLFGYVHTTPQVLAELEAGRSIGLDIPDLTALTWCVVQDIAVPSFLELIPDLGKGEASVLALAMEHPGSTVILDDLLGRQVAKSQHLPLSGTLGVLLLAKQAGLLPSVGGAVSLLLRSGFYCSRSVVNDILRIAGEAAEPD
jgi:predicted nucleic acid-binding protein